MRERFNVYCIKYFNNYCIWFLFLIIVTINTMTYTLKYSYINDANNEYEEEGIHQEVGSPSLL